MQNLVRTAALGFVAMSAAFSASAVAQDYPSKPVKIIVPFGAGGPADVFSRQLAQHLSRTQLKQTFVVENRPGAGSIIGTNEVAKSAPDGYTLLTMSNTHTTNESLTPNKPFQLMRDFVPVAGINYSDLVMVVHPSVQAKDVKEFIALAKKDPDKLNFASSGPATPYHMAGELFKHMTGTKIVHVPHKASGEMRSSVIGGHVQMAFDAVTTMTENVKAGQVRALGTSAQQALEGAAGRADHRRGRSSGLRVRPSGSASWRRREPRRRWSTSSTPRSTRPSTGPRCSPRGTSRARFRWR